MRIIKATVKDCKDINKIIRASINNIDYPYTKAQLKAWKYINRLSQIKFWFDKNEIFLVMDKIPIAIAALRKNKISRFFVLPEYQGKGVGRKLILFLEKKAKNGFTTTILESVPSALGFYLKLGYKKKEEIFPKYEGIEFKEIRMEKKLR